MSTASLNVNEVGSLRRDYSSPILSVRASEIRCSVVDLQTGENFYEYTGIP